MVVTDQKILTKKSDLVREDDFGYIKEELLWYIRLLQENNIAVLGLAAIQINLRDKAFVVYIENQLVYFINGHLIQGYDKVIREESCLSIPNLIFDVERFRTIYYKDDINGQKTYTGLIAQIIQHEHDHCEGKTLFQTGRLREDKLPHLF
jgi:peptide deformylase